MGRKDDLWENELWTQGEVASYFRVVPGTVKNWRDQGRLSHWQAPGSSRVLYFRNELRDFQEKYTISISKKGGDNAPGLKKIHKGKPVVSSIEEDWRI